jgi:hypothetical protein
VIILYIGGEGNGQEAQSRTNRLLPTPARRYSYGYCLLSPPMFTDFTATDRWTKKQVHCLYQALIVAIATRHADAVDIKFLVDGRPVWVALPHPAWVEYKQQTGKLITDSLAKEIAGHFLKTALESGEGLGREMYSLTVDETLKHLEGVVAGVEPQFAAAR